MSADHWAMSHHRIRTGNLHQSASSMPRLSSRLLLAPVTLAPRSSPWAITRWRFAAVVTVFGQLPFYPLQPFGQLGDLLVCLG